jgi:hypothetical protein
VRVSDLSIYVEIGELNISKILFVEESKEISNKLGKR